MATDTDLLAKARAGDRGAFDELVGRHRENVRRFAAVMADAETDDLVAEAVAVAWRDLPRFEGRSAFSTWLYGIALNLCRHALRDKGRHAETVEPSAMDARAARHGVLSSIYRRELVERMGFAIGRLPVSMREAFVLRYVEKLEYDEISAITGASPGATRVRAHRAKLLMKGELGAVVDTFWLE